MATLCRCLESCAASPPSCSSSIDISPGREESLHHLEVTTYCHCLEGFATVPTRCSSIDINLGREKSLNYLEVTMSYRCLESCVTSLTSCCGIDISLGREESLHHLEVTTACRCLESCVTFPAELQYWHQPGQRGISLLISPVRR